MSINMLYDMRPTVEWLKENYKKYNDLCFGGELKPNIELKVLSNLSKNCLAQATSWAKVTHGGQIIHPLTPRGIEFNGMYNFTEEGMVSTLIHEMIHIMDYQKFPEHYDSRTYKCHGVWFKTEAKRIEALTGIKIDTHGKFNVDYLEQTRDIDFSSEKAPTFVGFCKLVNKTNLYSWWMVKLQRRRVQQFIEEMKIANENGRGIVAYIDWYKSKIRNGSEFVDKKPRESIWNIRMNDSEKEEEIKENKLEYFTRTDIIPGFDESKESEMSALGNQYQAECVDIVKRVLDGVSNGERNGWFVTPNFTVRYTVEKDKNFLTGEKIEVANTIVSNKVGMFKDREIIERIRFDGSRPIEYYAKCLFVDMMRFLPKRFREQKMNIKKIIREVVEDFIDNETEGLNPDYPKVYKTKNGETILAIS